MTGSEGHDTINCIVIGEGLTGWGNCVTIQYLYRDKQIVWAEACHDTIDCIVTGRLRGVAAGCVAIQHIQGCDTASGRPAIRVGVRYTRPRCGQPQAATWPGHDQDKAQRIACARGLSALRAT